MNKSKIKVKPKNKVSVKKKNLSAKKNLVRAKIKNLQIKEKFERKFKMNFNLTLTIAFISGVLLIFASYAWFYASLDVKIDFINMVVSNESGLFISLDGVTFGSSVEISRDKVIDELKEKYPGHTNQWAIEGLSSVSSPGIKDTNSDKLSMFGSSRFAYKEDDKSETRYLNATLIDESKSSDRNVYIAFDIFLKNVSGSPKSDNLYLDEGTGVAFNKDIYNDYDGAINSIRFGFVKSGSTKTKDTVNNIQNLQCNNNCSSVIYEPNSLSHSDGSIEKIKKFGINLVNGVYMPTYAIKKEGQYLSIANGQIGTGIPLDTDHFELQKTITNFTNPIFEIPNGITKFRIYIWIEGQDVDSLETGSRRATLSIVINFIKDLAGYDV